MKRRYKKIFFALGVALSVLGCIPEVVNSQTRVSVGVTETMETFNPDGDSADLLYGIWRQGMDVI